MPDPLWPYILLGIVLFLLGARLAVAVKPLGRALLRLCNAFLRLTRIKPDAGRESVSEEALRALMDISEEKGLMRVRRKKALQRRSSARPSGLTATASRAPSRKRTIPINM